MTKNIKTKVLLATLLTMVMIFATAITAFAASNPYGFTYDDSASGKTVYKYYTYSSTSGNAVVTREFYSKVKSVYNPGGTLITDKAAGSGSMYVGYDVSGNLFIITSDGAIYKYDTKNSLTSVLASGATSFIYNTDDIITKVKTNGGTLDIATLKKVDDVDPGDPTPTNPTKEKNRVERYTNSANELVSEAYKDNKVKVKIVVSKDETKVLNETANVRLTDTLAGAKFLGFDSNYSVYLYEQNGTLYRFKFGSWYTAEKLSLGSAYKKFESDSKGFISKVITENGEFTIKQLTSSDKWKAKKTYAVNKGDYATLYTKGSTKSNTLQLKSGTLYLNGKKVAASVKSFGFVAKNKFAYITKKGVVYTATIKNPASVKKFVTKASKFTTSKSNGLLTKVKLTSGKNKNLA